MISSDCVHNCRKDIETPKLDEVMSSHEVKAMIRTHKSIKNAQVWIQLCDVLNGIF